jgi:hypothetical protein
MACEKCWGDAFLRSMMSNRPQADCYEELLRERVDKPCTKEEQDGKAIDEASGPGVCC